MGYGRHGGERFLENRLGFMMAWHGYFEPSAAEKAHGEFLKRVGGLARLGSLPGRERRRYAGLRRRALAVCERRQERVLASGIGLYLGVDVGEGCELFGVMLGRLGRGRLWRGSQFTKTQYAVPFLDCHLAVIRMLDLCQRAGILKEVNDEGGYWETRSAEKLARNLNASTRMIKTVTSVLKRVAELKGFEHHAPIDEAENYLRVDGGNGRRPPS